MNFIKKQIFIFLCLILTASFCFGESQFSAEEKAEEQEAIPSFAADAYIKGFDYGIKCSINLRKITRKLLKN